ncbi:MAG: hypothetical protein V3W45_04525, partial [Sedimentisphaerales bacterium]
MIKKRHSVIFFAVLVVSIAQATEYYVSPAGNDSKAGTLAQQAWKTINKVNITTFNAGDSILFE